MTQTPEPIKQQQISVKTAAKKKSPKPKPKSKAKTTGVKAMPTKSSAYKKIEASFEPFMEYNKMVAGSMESGYNMMMDSFQNYAKLGIDNMESGLKVRTPEDMISYLESQHSLAQKTSDMMMSDAKSFSDMGIKLFDNVRALYESTMKTSVSAATEAVKAA